MRPKAVVLKGGNSYGRARKTVSEVVRDDVFHVSFYDCYLVSFVSLRFFSAWLSGERSVWHAECGAG